MKTIFKNVYRGKRVLVTGNTGFKGVWLSLWLDELGADVTGYALAPPTDPNLFFLLKLENKIKQIIGDVRDEKKLREVFKKTKPEIVFHLAAQSLVRMSYREPRFTYETNIMGTVNVLETVRETESVKVLVNVTSDKCYDNKEWIYGYREYDSMGGYDPYSSSKGCAELITSAYRNSFFNPSEYGKVHNVALASVRAGNIIGGGDWAEDRLIPDCVRALVKDKTIVIRNPEAIRPWQHVLDPLSGYLWLGALLYLEKGMYADAWNFGPYDSVVSVEDVVEKVIDLWGDGCYQVNFDKKSHEAGLLKLDISKACSYIHWSPVYEVDQALSKTIYWYRRYYLEEKEEIIEYTLNQLRSYIKDAQNLGLEWSKQ
jgi:CDP-glucose 4,6-dehydratase